MRNLPFTDIGHCIYCDSIDEPLTREHVVPAGIGGNRSWNGEHEALVLRHASCENCREVTRKIEERYLKETLDRGRRRLELSRKGRRVDTFPARVKRGDDWLEEQIDFRRFDSPLIVPSFRAAKILQPDANGEFDVWIGNTMTADRTVDPAISDYRFGIPIYVPNFARMLAKIAHGYLVAHLGPTGFRPLAREMILAEPEDYNYLVGGFAPQDNPRGEGLPLHWLAIREEGRYWQVAVQLFAQFGGPVNYVIAGEIL